MAVELFILNKIVFLDRDGVINRKAPPHQHIHAIEDFILLPNVEKALNYCKNKGYKIIVVTNQRTLTENEINIIHAHMLQLLPQIDAVYTCNHEDGVCNCRKPKPGLLQQANLDFPVDKAKSILFGDSQSDIDAAKAFGIQGYLTYDLYSTVKEVL